MASPISAPPEKQPKVVQKLLVRTFALLVIVAAMIYGIQWYKNNKSDLSAGQVANTVGWISAVEFKNDGQEAIAVKPDLSVVRPTGWKDGATDRNVVWAPSGHFLFFISDRGTDGFQVFRWNPELPEAEVRSIGSRGRSNPTFKNNQEGSDQTMLITSGGNIMLFDPSERRQVQVLPPTGREISVGGDGDDSGAQSQFAAMYGSIGTSFRYARWCGPDNNYIAAIMKRDQGDILVVQNMVPKDGKFEAPQLVTAGEKIELDVNPKSGDVAYAVVGFQWPAQPPRDQSGKVLAMPYKNYVGIWTPASTNEAPIVVASLDDKTAFESPIIHPSGESFVAAVGPIKDGAVDHQMLISFPMKFGGGRDGKPILRGQIYEPAWSPSGDQIVYAKREGSARNIYVANKDGSSERSVTSGSGRYGNPQFSPQTK